MLIHFIHPEWGILSILNKNSNFLQRKRKKSKKKLAVVTETFGTLKEKMSSLQTKLEITILEKEASEFKLKVSKGKIRRLKEENNKILIQSEQILQQQENYMKIMMSQRERIRELELFLISNRLTMPNTLSSSTYSLSPPTSKKIPYSNTNEMIYVL